MNLRPLACVFTALTAILASLPSTAHAKPTSEQALRLTPIQEDVQYDVPTAEEVESCTVDALRDDERVGWLVVNPAGLTLRRFLDTNGDNKVDQWSYYRGGIEVYRDLDTDFNGKADQYRWLGTAGSRWGIDTDEDGQIDRWEVISPEEVSAEIIAALQQRNAARFRRVLITSEELENLGLGPEKQAAIEERLAAATRTFAELAGRQQVVTQDTEWIYFGGNRPGVVPAGTEGSTHDITVYENVVAMIETEGQHGQVFVGTLIQVGDVWRAIDLPGNLTGDAAALAGSGFFFNATITEPTPTQTEETPGDVIDETTQQLIAAMEELDQKLGQGQETPEIHEERAEILQQLAEASTSEEDRQAWLRQLVDSVSAAAQSGNYPAGAERLNEMAEELDDDDPLLPYITYRRMTAQYGIAMAEAAEQAAAGEQPDFGEIQTQWLASLEEFIDEYGTSDDAAEAMLQLAIANEFAGEDDKAKAWYNRIATEFPGSMLASKAAGAIRRLDSVGRVINLTGQTIDGNQLGLQNYRGKVVLIQYWATWSARCAEENEAIKALMARYGNREFAVVGVNLDGDRDTAVRYLQQNRLPWPQLHEPGGLDSRLANEMGIVTVPTMMLVDPSGKVIHRGIDISQLEGELNRLLRQ